MIEIEEYTNPYESSGYPYSATLSFGIALLPENINDNHYDGAQIRLFLIEVERMLLDYLKEYMIRVQHDNVNQNLGRRFLLYSKSALKCNFSSKEKREKVTTQVARQILRMTQIYFQNSNNNQYWAINQFDTYPYKPLKMEEVYEKTHLLLKIENALSDLPENEENLDEPQLSGKI